MTTAFSETFKHLFKEEDTDAATNPITNPFAYDQYQDQSSYALNQPQDNDDNELPPPVTLTSYLKDDPSVMLTQSAFTPDLLQPRAKRGRRARKCKGEMPTDIGAVTQYLTDATQLMSGIVQDYMKQEMGGEGFLDENMLMKNDEDEANVCSEQMFLEQAEFLIAETDNLTSLVEKSNIKVNSLIQRCREKTRMLVETVQVKMQNLMKSEEEQPRYAISLKREIESFIKLNSPTVREYQRRIDYHCKIYSDICQIQLQPIKETGVYTSQRPKYEFTPIKVLNDTKVEVKIQDTMLETNPRFQKDDVLGLSGCLMNGAIGIVNKTKGFTEIYEVPPNCTDPKDLLKGQSVDEIVTVLIKHADRLVINHSVYQKDSKIQQLHYRDPQCSVLIDDNTYLVALAKYDCFYRVTWNGRKYETKSIIMNYQMAKSKKYKIIKMYIHDQFLYCQSNKTIYKLPKDLQLDVYHRMHRPSSFERFYYGTDLIIDSALVQSDLSQILVLHQSGEVILLDTLSKFVTCKFTFSPEYPISKLYVPPNFNAQELPLILYENMGKLNMIDIQTCGIEVEGMELINLRNRKVAGQIVNWDDSERMYVVTVDFRGKICLSEISFSS